MTTKNLEKKIKHLEKRINTIEVSVLNLTSITQTKRQNLAVWQRTKGAISTKRAKAMLGHVQKSRRSADKLRT